MFYFWEKENIWIYVFFRDYPNILDLQHVRYINVDLRPSIYLFLKQFDVLFPHINCIKFEMGKYSIILAIF